MKKLAKPHPSQPNFSYDDESNPAVEAKLRMVRLPTDPAVPDSEQALFVKDELWVPISIVKDTIHILPGVPRLFEQLLEGLRPLLVPRLTESEGKGICRLLFSTPLAESEVAAYLKELAERVRDNGIKVGSYPRWGKSRNTITLVGRDARLLESLVSEIEARAQATRVTREDELDDDGADVDSG